MYDGKKCRINDKSAQRWRNDKPKKSSYVDHLAGFDVSVRAAEVESSACASSESATAPSGKTTKGFYRGGISHIFSITMPWFRSPTTVEPTTRPVLMPGGQRFQREASEIIPGRLYLSDALTARWGDTLDRLGVTHIVCVLEEPINYPRTKQDIKILHIPISDDPTSDLLSYFQSVTEFITEALGTMDIANVNKSEVRELNEVTNVLEGGDTSQPFPKTVSPSSSPSKSFSPFRALTRSPIQRSVTPESDQVADKKNNVVLVHCLAGMSRSATCVIAYLLATTSMNTAEATAYVKARRSIIMPNYGFEKQLRIWEAKYFVATRKRRISSKQIAMGLQGRIERYKMAANGSSTPTND